LEANKLDREAEDAKKHISRKAGVGAPMDMRGMIKILNEFYPDLPPFTSVEEIMDLELTLVLKMKSIPLDKHEVVMTLYAENGYPFSLAVNYDMKLI